MTFQTYAVLVSVICAILFGVLLVFPLTYVGNYGAPTGDDVSFMVRRAAPMFLGFAVPLFMMRASEPSATRAAFCWGIAVAFIGVAMTGIGEFIQGRANINIVIAAGGELLIAGFAVHFARQR